MSYLLSEWYNLYCWLDLRVHESTWWVYSSSTCSSTCFFPTLQIWFYQWAPGKKWQARQMSQPNLGGVIYLQGPCGARITPPSNTKLDTQLSRYILIEPVQKQPRREKKKKSNPISPPYIPASLALITFTRIRGQKADKPRISATYSQWGVTGGRLPYAPLRVKSH